MPTNGEVRRGLPPLSTAQPAVDTAGR